MPPLLRRLASLAVAGGVMLCAAALGHGPAAAQSGHVQTAALEAVPSRIVIAQAAQPETPAQPPVAATATVSDAERVAQVQADLKTWIAALEQVSATLQRPGIDSASLDELRAQVERVKTQSEDVLRGLQPRMKAVERVVSELAPKEEGAEAETEAVRRELAAQRESLATLTGLLKQVQVTQLRASELLTQIAEVRRVQLTQRLLTPTSSILEPTLWIRVVSDLPGNLTAVRLLVQDWFSLIYAKAGGWAVLFVLAAIVAAIVLIWPIRRVVLERTARDPANEDPHPVARSGAAVAITLVATVLPIVALFVLYRGLDLFELLPSRIDTALQAVFKVLVIFAFAQGLGRALIAPRRPSWRLVALSDDNADRMMRYVLVAAAIFGLGVLVDEMAVILGMSAESADAATAIAAMSIGLVIMGALRVAAAGREEADSVGPTGLVMLWRWIMPLFWLAALIAIAAPVFGYIHFAWFVAEQSVWSISILALLHLLLLFIDDVTVSAFQANTPLGRAMRESLGTGGGSIEQIGVLLGGILRILLIVAGAAAILAPWGVSTTDVTSLVRQAVFGFQIGSFTFALSDVVIALVIFVIGLTVTRAVQRWLENRYLPHTKLDVGLKTSIRTTFGYIGVIIAGMVAFSFLGLDLQNIAIVAGALSVGIGFGLQSIVNNFVSGLILLAERPIKVGDWIVVGGEQGYVRRINVRATEVETFDRQTVIVPNSDLISGVVKNWMHHDTTGRIIVGVGVAYDSDPEQVRDILLAIARDNEHLLAYPAPNVYFMEFGASSLDFELRAYLANIDQSLTVKSELRFEIMRRFREAGIEIPFPQQDVHLRDMDRLEAALGHPKTDAR